jgi:hypothetical protein
LLLLLTISSELRHGLLCWTCCHGLQLPKGKLIQCKVSTALQLCYSVMLCLMIYSRVLNGIRMSVKFTANLPSQLYGIQQ